MVKRKVYLKRKVYHRRSRTHVGTSDVAKCGEVYPQINFSVIPRRAWVRLNGLRTSVGRFRSFLYKWVWPLLQLVSVAKKYKPSTTLSSNVQSIDLLMDRMAWRFWTMRQSNGCSTPATRSRAIKQWLEELAQKKKCWRGKPVCSALVCLCALTKIISQIWRPLFTWGYGGLFLQLGLQNRHY